MGYALAVATLVITVVLSYHFTNDYLETGKLENLIADAIVTAGGSMLVGGLIRKASGSAKWGYFAAGVSLVITGIVDLTLVTGNVIKEGLNWKNVLALAEDAVKVGIGSMLMTKALPQGWGITKVDGFVFGFLLSAGVALAVSGVSRYDYDKGFDIESIEYMGLAAGAIGGAVAKIARHIGLTGWEGFVAGFTFTAGVELLVMALSRWFTDGKFDTDTQIQLGIASLLIGAAVSRVGKNIGLTPMSGFTVGFGFTAGVSLLVMGLSEWFKDDKFDASTMIKLGVASLLIGTAIKGLASTIGLTPWGGFVAGFGFTAGVSLLIMGVSR